MSLAYLQWSAKLWEVRYSQGATAPMLWLLAAMGKAEGCVARGEWRGRATALSVAPEFRRLGWAAKSMERLEETSEKWDRADSLARFVLPHPTGRRGLSGLQRAPTRRSGTPSAPLLRSGGPEGTPVSVHVPFTASDLLNCKQVVGSYRNNPEGMYSTRVKEYQKLILYGIQHGVQKPNNLSKLSEVRQGHKETPSAFSERLCEVARKRTDLDPEDDSNLQLFNTLFIGQAAADIRKR
ncbi:hypothetical protein QYF61_009534 [Mycteria americana]|uniref:Core shell protein Gag P30 domain-containing protein n=1 Tax=Mycteria americana TaxID=33587 RepID=A0AAN7RK72_MYCAM|nr:hypothetical protein QYF61_009534 [Mycteria americana]